MPLMQKVEHLETILEQSLYKFTTALFCQVEKYSTDYTDKMSVITNNLQLKKKKVKIYCQGCQIGCL